MTSHYRQHGLALTALAALALALPLGTQAQQGDVRAQIAGANGIDYAANELGSPWNFDDSTNFAFEYTRTNGNVANLRVENGKLKARSATSDPRITLLVPSNSQLNPVMPEGGLRPIDTATYKYLTVSINISKSSYAIVFWQNATGSSYEGTGLTKLNAGDNVVTIDLTAGGANSSGAWDGQVQGLYFDPTLEANIDFEIDYVLLTNVVPGAVTNLPPQVAITAPSYISGADYATTELGNSWDMNDAGDVSATRKLGSYNFNGGMLNASGVQDNNDCGGGLICGDPQVTLRTSGQINTAKYKYATYRMQLDGTIDTDLGSITRMTWWSSIPEQSTQTEAWVTYEGFRTVSGDLSSLKLLPGFFKTWQQSSPTTFRFDPHEFAAPRSFHLDYVMLTSDDQGRTNASYNIRYTASDANGDNLTSTFFYYPVGQPNNLTQLTCAANAVQAQPAAGQNTVFMPLALGKAGPPIAPAGSTCRWDTTGIAPGVYKIVIETSDGVNTVRRTSETNVVLSS